MVTDTGPGTFRKYESRKVTVFRPISNPLRLLLQAIPLQCRWKALTLYGRAAKQAVRKRAGRVAEWLKALPC